jgi:hypothetical protein
MFGLLGSLFSGGIGAILSPIMGFFTSANVVKGQEFAALTGAEQAEYIAYAQAIGVMNNSKIAANAWWGAHLMIYLFGLPAALHWNAVFLDSTFRFGWHVPALPGGYAGAELNIALSFFILAPAMPIVTSIAGLLGRRNNG